jgi:hypothetical protein
MIYTPEQIEKMLRPLLETLQADKRPEAVDQALGALSGFIAQDRIAFMDNAPSETSDGYHTFRDLYRFRLLYNAALFNEWADKGLYDTSKSYRHSDGELCFGKENYFVVMAELPTGQISNHYKGEHWDLFAVPEVAQAPIWDGHTAQMVADRLEEFLKSRYPKVQSKDESNVSPSR